MNREDSAIAHGDTQPNRDSENYMPELKALKDNQVAYQIAAATERQFRDRMIAGWRDIIHSYLKMLGNGDPILLHKVIDDMDEFLRRSKK